MAVLGAHDEIVSKASVIVGAAAASPRQLTGSVSIV